MKKKSISLWLLLMFAVGTFVGQPVLAEEKNDENKGKEAVKEQTMTQGQLAIILARRLGLVVGTPLSASPAVAILALEQVGVSPSGGWSSDAEVTTGDLASILNILLGNEVDPNAEDQAQAEVDAAIASGVNFANITSALATSGILSSGQRDSTTPAASTFNDPLIRLPPGRPVDTFENILRDETPFNPPGLPPLTPNRPS